MNITNSRLGALLATALILGGVTAMAGPAGKAAPRLIPPNSMAYGNSLEGWQSIYWRWYYTGADPATSLVGGVQLMPLPPATQIAGSWTVEDPAVLSGTLEITLPAGTPFVLPEMGWVGERYGTPAPWPSDDPPIANEDFLNALSLVLTVDGKELITDVNKAAFYIPPSYFEPIVTYPQPSPYNSIAGIFYQGVGFVSPPLSVGVHTIHLYESFILPEGVYERFAGGLIYDNTWIITVVPR